LVGTATHTTICRFCHAYCGIEVDVVENRAVAVRGDRAHAVSQGFTCEKGRQLPNQHNDPNRIRATLRRRSDGTFEEIPSESAMDEVAARLQSVIAEHGPRAVALYNGTKSWSNVSFALGLSWLNGIGSPSFYSTVTVDQPAKTMAGALHGYWQGGYHRIDESDVVLFVGTNPLESFLVESVKLPCPNSLVYLRDNVRRGLDVIVIDPRRTETAQHAAIHLAVTPGEDPTLLAGMVRLIIDEELYDRAFLAENAERLEVLRRAVEPFTLDYVERRAGVPADDVARAARHFARGPRGSAVAGTGPNMAPHPLSTEMLVCALNTLCGRYGREGDAVNHAGVLGAGYEPREGALPPREFWGYLEQPRVRGLRTLNWEQPSAALCDEILTPGDGQVRALICNGGNPAVAFPDQEKVVRALASLDLLVCLDVHLGATAQLADFVFGCKLSLEKPDYTRHLEWYFPTPFAQYTPAILDAEGDVIDECELFWGLAHRMRVPLELGRAPLGPPVASPRAVDIDVKPTTDEMMEIEAADARIPLAEVKRYPSGHVFDEARKTVGPRKPEAARFDLAPPLFLEDLARVVAEPVVDGAGYRAGERYTHRLASRRLRQVFNSTGVHLAGLNGRGPGNPAYLNPADMAATGLADGDLVEIVSEHGRIVGVARPDEGLRAGVVSMSHAWGALPGDDDVVHHPETGACTNRLIANDTDFEPLSGQCRQSGIPVNLRPVAATRSGGASYDEHDDRGGNSQ
jgi:anaerobic selenocysteine-containing dehydrogenase